MIVTRKDPSDQLTDWLCGQKKNGEKREKKWFLFLYLFFFCFLFLAVEV